MTTDTRTPAESIDEEKLEELVETSLVDLGATVHAALAVTGDTLGLYQALADVGPLTSTGLAETTDTVERYVREWLRSQAAGGYVTYDPETDRYSLSSEQASEHGWVNSNGTVSFVDTTSISTTTELAIHCTRKSSARPRFRSEGTSLDAPGISGV